MKLTAASIIPLLACVGSSRPDDDADLAWIDQPNSWHQQAIRIVDHPFTTLAEVSDYKITSSRHKSLKYSSCGASLTMQLRSFGLAAKKAGVSVVELVGPQKTKRCVGVWYGGLGLCDHINGTYPASDGTLEEWQQMLKEIRPVRLMWWANFASEPAWPLFPPTHPRPLGIPVGRPQRLDA
jgi:hypothetical protein